jgi:hypothetical protein
MASVILSGGGPGPKIWIVAGEFREAERWARESGENPHRCFWVSDVSALRGVTFDGPSGNQLVWVGTYRERPDFREIAAEVEMRSGPLPPPPGPDPLKVLMDTMKSDPLSPEAIKALFGEEEAKKPMRTMKARPKINYVEIATCIAETILDPDERSALVDRLLPVLGADPAFMPGYFRDLAGG